MKYWISIWYYVAIHVYTIYVLFIYVKIKVYNTHSKICVCTYTDKDIQNIPFV